MEMAHRDMGNRTTMTNPADKALADANMKMHKAMDMPMTGDADADFVRGMIPHHQGAVDMAKVELQYGKDPEIRKFAQRIIDGQGKEIGMMRAWLAKHPAK
jgi:uncharacterized protein (DUF305 family)